MRMRGRVTAAIRRMFTCGILAHAVAMHTQQTVTIQMPKRAAVLEADLYGAGERGVLLVHGGRFSKESWKPQAEVLAQHGLRVLALRFRGDGRNPDGSSGTFGSSAENAEDVLAAIQYLHTQGVKSVFAVGASLGGDAVGEANARSSPGEIARSVLLASEGGDMPEKLSGRKLFIVAREDRSGAGPRLPGILAHYRRAPRPKKLLVLKGSAHAQFLFASDQGARALREMMRFLTEP